MPVSFQQFKNYHFSQPTVFGHHVVNYDAEKHVCSKDKKQQTEKHCICNKWDLMCDDIETAKEKALSTLFPELLDNPKCTFMLLSNLAETDWISVNCSDRMLAILFCSVRNTNFTQSTNSQRFVDNVSCPPNSIYHNKTCFNFLWFQSKYNGSLSKLCTKTSMKTTTFLFADWEHILDAVQPTFPPILIAENSHHVKHISMKKYHNIFILKHKSVSIPLIDAEGFTICSISANKSHSKPKKHLLQCEKGGFISQSELCDDIPDCPFGMSDEENCMCEVSCIQIYNCKSTKQQDEMLSCGFLCHRGKYGTCEKYISDKLTKIPAEHDLQDILFLCSNASYINFYKVNDLMPDCLAAEDEPELLALLRNNNQKSCENHSQLPCAEGHSKCFEIEDICIFDLDTDGGLYPCKNGAHVENCEEILCNKKFKCEKSYCIPWQFVCNSQWDCPDGSDENIFHFCNKEQCISMYLCKNREHMCIPLSNVCDNFADCPSSDDEVLCDLSSVDCPRHCHCLVYALQCQNVSFVFQKMAKLPFHFLAVFESFVKDVKLINNVFGDAVHVSIQNSQIVDICGIFTDENMHDVIQTDFSKNRISILRIFCFHNHQNIMNIHLSDNDIKHINVYSFANLTSLTKLDLSRNPLQCLAPYFLTNASNLLLLNLSENYFHYFSSTTFKVLDVKLIVTTNYKICCITHKNSKCEALPPWFISCSDLLPTEHLKLLFYIISAIVVLLNFLSLVTHIHARQSAGTYIFLVVAVNTTDFLCAVYLLIIWISDLNLYKIFVLQETVWRSSVSCHFAFAIVITYTVNIQFVLILLSLSRMMVVKNPIHTSFQQFKFVMRLLSLFFCVSSLMGISLTSAVSQCSGRLLPISLCLPFVDPTNSIDLIKVIVWLTLISQTATSGAIITMHMLLLHEVKTVSNIVMGHRHKQGNNVALVCQLVVITASNILCWLPTNIVYLVSMFLTRYPIDLVIWTTIAVLPLNACINPTVFILASMRKKCATHRFERSNTFTTESATVT